MGHTQPGSLVGQPYHRAVQALWGELGIWDYLHYDEDGQLWINDLRVIDAVERYGSPLEVVDTTIVERRAREWMALSQEVAAQVGYPAPLDYFYAAKANMASEITHAAYRTGWNAECSSAQDLAHLVWLNERGLLPPGLRVVCNGFKLPPTCYGWPKGRRPPAARGVELPPDTLSARVRRMPYAERILQLARQGWAITCILDQGEVEYFAAAGNPPLDVGLRLRSWGAGSMAELDTVVSRFGMSRWELEEAAARIARAHHLRLRTLHTMIGAAETIPVARFVAGLLAGARVWAGLRAKYPTLRELNIGGGVPPLGEPWDHRGFLERLLEGLLAVSGQAGVPPPEVAFEFGSLIAAESTLHVFKVLQRKPNATVQWAILDGGLMAAIPDMLILHRPFRFLAVNGALRPAEAVILGDLTCDSDGRYPPRDFQDPTAVLLPGGTDPQYVAIQGVGAYQEILAGVRGAHHCGLLEALELIIEPGADGSPRARLMPRQTSTDAATVLGYTDQAAEALRVAMAASTDDPA